MLLLMAVAAFLLVPSTPLLQNVAPVMDTALLLVPAIAVCAALGWAVGGRAWLAALWASLAVVLVLWHGLSHITYTALQCGWALVLAASFGLVCAASPPATRFLSRALTALALSVALVGLLTLGSRNAASAVSQSIHSECDLAAEQSPQLGQGDREHRGMEGLDRELTPGHRLRDRGASAR